MDKTQYKDIYVFAEQRHGEVQKVAYELLGKARELADSINQKVYAVLLGDSISAHSPSLIAHGADFVIEIEDEA